MAIPTERQWRVVRTPGMVVRTRILVPALRTQARHFASRGCCPLNGTLFPLWEAALSPLWSCVPGSWLWLGLWNDRKAQWIPAIASQKQKTLSLNLKASQNAIPRGAIRAWALECVSGTFKWQAIAPHLFVKATAIFLQVWPYTFQLARAAWGLRLQAHNHWLLRLPKTGPWWMRRHVRLPCCSSHQVATERALGETAWEGGTVSKSRDALGLLCQGVQTSEIGSVQDSKGACLVSHFAAKRSKWWICQGSSVEWWEREGLYSHSPGCKMRTIISAPKDWGQESSPNSGAW